MIARYDDPSIDWNDIEMDTDEEYDVFVKQALEIKDQLNEDMKSFVGYTVECIYEYLEEDDSYVIIENEEEVKDWFEDEDEDITAVFVDKGMTSEVWNKDIDLKRYTETFKVFRRDRAPFFLTISAFTEQYCDCLNGAPINYLKIEMKEENGNEIRGHQLYELLGITCDDAISFAVEEGIPEDIGYEYYGDSII